VADVIYVTSAYWPYLAAVFIVGILIGWWAEGRRQGDVRAWLRNDRAER
jgi:hypothetical protein